MRQLGARTEDLERVAEELQARVHEVTVRDAELLRDADVIKGLREALELLSRIEEERRQAEAARLTHRLRAMLTRNRSSSDAPVPSSSHRRWLVRGRLGYIRTYRALRNSPDFDARYYLSRYPEVAAAGLDPLAHYIEYGAREGRDPSARFSTSRYLELHPEVAAAGINPLLAASAAPARRRRRAISQFASWLRRPTPRRLRYIRTYLALRRSGGFDSRYYLARYPDVAGTGLDPLMHYVEHGMREGRSPTPRHGQPVAVGEGRRGESVGEA
jgi:hypothetical protein